MPTRIPYWMMVAAAALTLAASAGRAAPQPLNLPPSQVQAFANVRAVRIEISERHTGTDVRLESDIRRFTTAMLKAAGWSVAPAAPAALTLDLTGKVTETQVDHLLFSESKQPRTVRHADVTGEYGLAANRVKLVGRLDGSGDHLLEAFLGSGYLESLVGTLNALRKVPPHKLGEPLAADENATVRRYGVRLLNHFGEKESVPTLIRLLKDDDELVRTEAAGALGELGGPQAVEPLIELVRRPGHGYDECGAIEALGKLGDPRAIVTLLEFLASLQETPERSRHTTQAWYRATDAVYGLPPSVTLPEFIKALKHANAKVRGVALTLLSDLLHGVGNHALAAKDVATIREHMDALLATLADADRDVRRSGAAPLGTLDDPRALPALQRAAKNDPDERVRMAAQTAVNMIEQKQRQSQAEPADPQS